LKFNISFGNVYEPSLGFNTQFLRVSLGQDMIRFFQMALEEAGCTVRIHMSQVDEDATNIFFDHFRIPEQAEALRKKGIKFGLICTEPMTEPGRYNSFELDDEKSKETYRRFAISAQQANFVWYLLESAESTCKQLNPNSHLLRFGHIPGYETLRDVRQRTPDIDFTISGEPTQRRAARAAELIARGAKVSLSAYDPTYVRDNILERVRGTLAIQKSDQHSIFSIARIHHAISNKVPILVEYGGPKQYLSPFCVTASSDDFIDTCIQFLARDHIAYAEDAYDRFAAKMPMQPMMHKLLSDTFGKYS
jgi:hypothetical protein